MSEFGQNKSVNLLNIRDVLKTCPSCNFVKDELRVEIGGICLSLILHNVLSVPALKSCYKGFVSSEAPDFIVELYGNENVTFAVGIERELENQGSDVFFLCNLYAAHINLADRKGFLILGSDLYPELLVPILLFFYSYIVVLYDGFLLHAAGVINDGRGYIFPGRSGSGKTTITELSKGMVILSDDRIIIRKTANSYRVFSTPFWWDFRNASNVSAELHRILLLKQDREVYYKKVGYSEAVSELLTCTFVRGLLVPYVQHVMHLVSDMVNQTDLYEMHFVRDNSFWRIPNEP